MPLFEMKNNSLAYINEIPFPLEKDIQRLCKTNRNYLSPSYHCSGRRRE